MKRLLASAVTLLALGTSFQRGVSSEGFFVGGSPLSVTAVDIEEEWDERSETVVSVSRIPLGTRTLSPADATGLDSLISFYRSGPEKVCTTTEAADIRHLFNGRVVAAERFVDGSGSAWDRGLTTFGRILGQFEKE